MLKNADAAELMQDARAMQAAGERLLAAGDWRDAAEKGWLAARNASQALLLEVNGEEQPRTPNISAGIRALAHQRGGRFVELKPSWRRWLITCIARRSTAASMWTTFPTWCAA